MKKRNSNLRFFALLSLLAWGGTGKAADPHGPVGEDGDGHGAIAVTRCAADDGHAHGEAAKAGHGGDDDHAHVDATGPIEERANAECEHETPIYRCDECRYEAGLVKLDPRLLKAEKGGGLIRTQAVEQVEFRETLALTAEVALNENTAVHISPRIAGILDSVPIDMGSRVKAGDVLFTIVSVDLGRTLAEYERNRTLVELSEKVLVRENKLLERKIGSHQDLIEAQKEFEQNRAELRASEQALHVLGMTEEDLASLKEPRHGPQTGRLAVRAPRDGIVLEKHAVAGELAEPGKDVMLVADLDTVWVWANVHSRDLARLIAAEKAETIPVEIRVSAFPDRRFRGVLDYVGATMDEGSRTVKVRATVKNPGRELKPGMFCEAVVGLGGGNEAKALAVPGSAVFADEGKSFVFKHWKDDYFARQDVRLGRVDDGRVEILDGLQAGDTILSEGGFLLKSDVLREKMGAGCAD